MEHKDEMKPWGGVSDVLEDKHHVGEKEKNNVYEQEFQTLISSWILR